MGELARRMEALEHEGAARDLVIRENREREQEEHTAIRKEVGDAFERVQNRLFMGIGGLMTTVVGAAIVQVFATKGSK